MTPYPISFQDARDAVERLNQYREAAREILDFLNSIEGHGYGGMAAFEIARQHAKEAAR